MAELSDADKEFIKELREAKENKSLTRREALSIAGGVLGGGVLGAAGTVETVSADASTTDTDGNVGLPDDRVDVFAEGVDSVSVGADGVDAGRQNRTHYASAEAEAAGAATDAQIQSVINASSPGDTVVIDGLEDATGVSEPYSVGAAVTIPSDRQVLVAAHVQASASVNAFENADQTNGNSNIRIRGTAGGLLDGNAGTGVRGIEFNKGSEYVVESLRMTDWADDHVIVWAAPESRVEGCHCSGGATSTGGTGVPAQIRVGLNGADTPGDYVVAGNICVNGDTGIIARQTRNVTIQGNVVVTPKRNGIMVETDVSDFAVVGNTVRDGGTANKVHGQIYVTLSDNGTVGGNTCSGKTNGHGIHVEEDCNDVSVDGNTCADNGLKGIFANIGGAASSPVGCSFDGNTCVRNQHDGIRLVSHEHASVDGNTCRNNNQSASTYDGIHLTDCLDVSCGDNSCTANTYGIRATGTTDYVAYAGNTTRGNGTGGLSTNGTNSLTAANV